MTIPFTDADLQVAGKTIYGEARGEPLRGQQAVAWVIRNRAAWRPPSWWGHDIQGVCLKPWQFSCWNQNSPEYAAMHAIGPQFDPFIEVARSVFSDEVEDPTKGSTMYQVIGTGAKWSKGLPIAAIIGRHEFYVLGPE